MPFLNNKPQPHDVLDADLIRNQFNGLQADYDSKIAAIPSGPPGPPGPPFATAIIDAVTTLGPDDAATVSVSFDGNNVHFTFGIPRGHDGTNGNDGGPGPKGETGDQGGQGPMGEVSNQTLNDTVNNAIGGTARNINGVIGAFTGTFSDPPTQAEMLAYVDYQESLRQALAR